ncbi:MAG: hypothetical protein ACRD1G_01240, partial [Acidimicrobiales bacterium]
MRRPCISVAAGLGMVAALLIPATTAGASGPPLYKSTVALASVGNVPSVGAEAYSFNEFGNEIHLTGTKLGKVVVTMSSWGCQTGSWYAGNCGTIPGATFPATITFNIYRGPYDPTTYVPGSLIASVTKPFNFPYRPSANYTHCNGGNAGKWWDSSLHACLNGKAVSISFAFNVNLPTQDIIFGIAYNTTHY